MPTAQASPSHASSLWHTTSLWRSWRTLSRWLALPSLWLIAAYRRWLSPRLPPACRFSPTCSAYALEALQRYGLFKGWYLACRRILRCHPLHPGGHDPVP